MIRLDRVAVTYPGGSVGLRPTSLELRRGELTVLLGASGAGKSTLLRTLNFLTEPTAGNVVVDDVGTLARGRTLDLHRRRTGMVFQQHHLIGRLTALANVLVGRIGFHGSLRTLLPLPRRDREIALECLARVGLLHKALERADRLSGGQRQRVGIARALAQGPQILLADEPVASLDPVTAGEILELIRSVGRQDALTTVVSLHQVDLALAHADRVVGLTDGRVVFDSRPPEIEPGDLAAVYRGSAPEPRRPDCPPPLSFPATVTETRT